MHKYVRPLEKWRVLDIGCGPADIFECMPTVEYVGFDMNKRYIDMAIEKYGESGTFLCEMVNREMVRRFQLFDVVLVIGVIHHLDDAEVKYLFEIAFSALKKGGKVVAVEPCYEKGQSAFVRFLLSSDRGRHVRTSEEYVRLASELFVEVGAVVHNNLLRLPYTQIVLECVK